MRDSGFAIVSFEFTLLKLSPVVDIDIYQIYSNVGDAEEKKTNQ